MYPTSHQLLYQSNGLMVTHGFRQIIYDYTIMVKGRNGKMVKMVVMQLPWVSEFHGRSHKDLEMIILVTPTLSLTMIILQWPYVRLKLYCWGRPKYINGKNILLRVIWFFDWWHHVRSHHSVNFGVRRPRLSGNMLFMYHAISRDQWSKGHFFDKFDVCRYYCNGDKTFLCYMTWFVRLINGLCDFLNKILSSEVTSLSCLVTTGLAEVEI